MRDDYLWNKSGEPDPEIQRLENLLSPLGHRGRALRQPGLSWRIGSFPVILSIAASVLLLLGGAWIVRQRMQPAWKVSTIQGRPSVTRLAKGQRLETDARSSALLEMGAVGEVSVEPETSLSVLSVKPKEQRLDLKRGTIHALIWAPPGNFYVNTPSSQTVDLGCAYTLKVDDAGVGLVRVSTGWVAFENHGRESFIPENAACVTRPGKGPGIPYYEDAPSALRDALARFDERDDPAAVDIILSVARPRDAITLWHLLRRVDANRRGPVYDRLAGMIAVPKDVTREGAMAGDAKTIDSLWDALDLGTTGWWRMWKSRMPRR